MAEPAQPLTPAITVEPLPYRRDKRAWDLLLLLLLTPLILPLGALILLLILLDMLLWREDRGPIMYTVPRISRGRAFGMYKLRILKQSVIDHARAQADGEPDMKPNEKDRANLTRMGYWLRNYYLDELGQVLNILRGDMTFVGPRPWPPDIYHTQLASTAATKGRVPCGLCGPVQASKGQEIDYHALERDYVDAYASLGSLALLRLDATHLWRTFRKQLEGEGL